MTYSVTETISAPLTIRSGENNQHITRVRFHTLQVIGTAALAAEVDNSGTLTDLGSFTDEIINLNGYNYTALRLTPIGTATVAMAGVDETDQ